ncbi:alpha/beta hydrolase [Pedobacter sp. HMWF019]|uniref:alpha/beta hydrolase n=1 Tax=Pedobacter sp. HMWF019 TaxID=2056856 RepID=UPI000D38419A|nr:alpha/beta hydrolase [Pedobacter sp. HMWF019]PTT01959.1 alpha/beta hydrolase [Pedobacter sp. HMWF019]
MDLNLTQGYQPDVLGQGFEALTFPQTDDYEGKVVGTVIRKSCPQTSSLAVLYIHGFNDYFFQTEMAEQYIKNGYNFYALDLRKYGRSFLPHQKMNNVRDLAEYDADINFALTLLKKEGNTIVLLSGHSTGGLIVSLFAAKNINSELFHAVFLNSPFWGMNLGLLKKNLGIPLVSWWGKEHPDVKIDGGFSPLYGLSLHKDFYGEWDYNLVWKPNVAPRVNCGWVRAIHFGHKRVKAGLHISTPVLVVHSLKSIREKKWSDRMFSGDAVLNVKDMDRQAAGIQGDCQVTVIDGALHDVVLSPKPVREEVYAALFAWLNSVIIRT